VPTGRDGQVRGARLPGQRQAERGDQVRQAGVLPALQRRAADGRHGHVGPGAAGRGHPGGVPPAFRRDAVLGGRRNGRRDERPVGAAAGQPDRRVRQRVPKLLDRCVRTGRRPVVRLLMAVIIITT